VRTVVYAGVSLDGFIAGKDGDISWLAAFENKEINDSYKNFMTEVDAIVIGRGTYETVISFSAWPYEKKAFLLSTSIKQVPEKLKDKIEIISMKPGEIRKYLSDNGFTNIYVDGGKVIQGFLKDDCIDEIIITRLPVLLGSGIPLFGSLSDMLEFTHIRTDVYSNGLVKSHYARKRKESIRGPFF
jgi:dihydrofolate reductase